MRIELAILEITNKCNLKCKHCYGFFQDCNIMNITMFENVVKQLYNKGCTKFIISGGEPLTLGDRIKEYILILKKYNIPFIALTTNGTLDTINDKSIFEMIDMIQVSIDGIEPIHDEIRGKNMYKRSINFIQKVKEINSNVSIMMTVNKINFKYIQKVYDLANKLKVKFAIEVMTPCGRGKDLSVINKNQMKKLKQFVLNNKIECSDPISFCNTNIEFFNNDFFIGCSAGTKALCIDSNFEVFPCVRLRTSLGNLSKNTLDFILSNKIITNLANRDKLLGKCGICKNKYICGGCRARAYNATGNYMSEDKWCIDYEKKD